MPPAIPSLLIRSWVCGSSVSPTYLLCKIARRQHFTRSQVRPTLLSVICVGRVTGGKVRVQSSVSAMPDDFWRRCLGLNRALGHGAAYRCSIDAMALQPVSFWQPCPSLFYPGWQQNRAIPQWQLAALAAARLLELLWRLVAAWCPCSASCSQPS